MGQPVDQRGLELLLDPVQATGHHSRNVSHIHKELVFALHEDFANFYLDHVKLAVELFLIFHLGVMTRNAVVIVSGVQALI